MPGCAVLVTARQRLPEVAGAHHVAPLEPLERAEATELFLRVVADAGINLENDLAAVDRVVTLCGGLPLALRIAGALRVHNHPRPTAELADRLARQGPAAFAYGELNVARTIGAGFERLDDGARQLFLALGLLPLTGFGLWTAAALLGGADASVPLSQLAASFMIESVEPEMRYRFHDLTREYARRRALGEYAGDQGYTSARSTGRCSPSSGGPTHACTGGTSRSCTATSPPGTRRRRRWPRSTRTRLTGSTRSARTSGRRSSTAPSSA